MEKGSPIVSALALMTHILPAKHGKGAACYCKLVRCAGCDYFWGKKPDVGHAVNAQEKLPNCLGKKFGAVLFHGRILRWVSENLNHTNLPLFGLTDYHISYILN